MSKESIGFIAEEKGVGSPPSLLLRKDGTLVKSEWDGSRRGYDLFDVTDSAFMHLDRFVELEPGATLMSLYEMMAATSYGILDLVLTDCFVAVQVDNFKARVSAGDVKDRDPGYSPEKIDHLELYWHLEKDSTSGQMEGLVRPNLHGVGVELKEPYDMWEVGSRIPWSVSATPVEELLHVPLKLDAVAKVYEGAYGHERYGEEIDSFVMDFTLRNVIVGVLWDTSFYGVPAESLDFRGRLRSISEELALRAKSLPSGEPEKMPSSAP